MRDIYNITRRVYWGWMGGVGGGVGGERVVWGSLG